MVSLWGSHKKDNGHAPDEDGEEPRATSSHTQPRESEDANERTRLLPRHDQGVGYLSPDDPAVRTCVIEENMVTDREYRSALTICGVFELYDGSKSSSS